MNGPQHYRLAEILADRSEKIMESLMSERDGDGNINRDHAHDAMLMATVAAAQGELHARMAAVAATVDVNLNEITLRYEDEWVAATVKHEFYEDEESIENLLKDVLKAAVRDI